MEVLALQCLPTSGNRSQGLKTFFTAAATRANDGVWDPAGLCGEIQPDLDRQGLSAAFAKAADLADQACAAAAEGGTDEVLRLWQEISGEDFPAPARAPKRASLIGAPALITPPPHQGRTPRMTTTPARGTRTPITWWECEPRRLRRDTEEIPARFPRLVFTDEGAGGWEGMLPHWPFDRPEPAHLTDWIGEHGLRLRLEYGHAYPMVAPRIFPLDPLPEPWEWTQHRWHVNGDASLCLLHDDIWTGRESAVDLLSPYSSERPRQDFQARVCHHAPVTLRHG
ncbi:hypothetical protein GCM10010245_86740 [Streptomyces spectabilis]|nr:hypothetical protein GCM10010245_86740 [Streptomyces spectabilis]